MSFLVKTGQNIWERLKQARVKEKTIFIILLAGVVILLIPMLAIARYNVPCTDDFSHGSATHSAWEQSHSFLDVLSKSMQHIKRLYFGWTGLYSTMFTSSLQPAVFGEEWYWLTTYIMLLSLGGGIVYLSAVVFRRIFKAAWYQTGIIITVLAAVCTQLLPSPVQAFYWYSGSVCYTFFFGLSLVLYAKVLTYIHLSPESLSPAKRVLRLFSMSILSAAIAGSNYATALTTAILYACVLVLMLVRKRYSCLGLAVPFCVFMAGFIISVLAPGNSVRQAAFQDRPSALVSIALSFGIAAKYAYSWLAPSLVFLVIFLVPLLYKITGGTSYSYSHPILILSGSFCLFASMFCPTIYAMGSAGPERLLNIIYFAFVILLILDLFYILGWCRRAAEKRGLCAKTEGQGSKGERQEYSMAFLLVVSMLFLSGSIAGEAHHFTSSNALRELLQGEADAYYNTARERQELLNDASQQDVVLPRYPVLPWILYFDDISTEPGDWRNVAIRNYYQKNSVVLEPEVLEPEG